MTLRGEGDKNGRFQYLGSVERWDSEWVKISSHQEDGIENLQEISCEMGLRKAGGLDLVMPISVTLAPGVPQCQIPVTLAPFLPIRAHQSPLYIKDSFRDSAEAPHPQTGTSTLGLLPRGRAFLSGLLALREFKLGKRAHQGQEKS